MTATWTEWRTSRAKRRERQGVERDAVARPVEAFDLASNDYLGLRDHPRVRAAAASHLDDGPVGAGASRVVSGTHPVHDRLERALTDLTGAGAALVCSSGYLANMTLIGALGGPNSRVLLDKHVHASIHDGARAAHTARETFAHNDLDALEMLLSTSDRRTTVVVESIYSALGDAAPLARIAELCRAHDAALMIDEAHSLAVVPGHSMVRATDLWGLGGPPVFVTATLSKALGAQGGVILTGGDDAAKWRRHIINTGRGFIFDTGLAPVVAAAAVTAVEMVCDGALAARCRENRAMISAALRRRPELFDHVESGPGALVSVRMPSPDAAVTAATELRRHGVAVGCFRPPSVPDRWSRLRITASARLTRAETAVAAEMIAEVAARYWGAPVRAPFDDVDGRPVDRRADQVLVSDSDEVRRVFGDAETFAADNALTALQPLSRPTARALAAAKFRLPKVLASAGGPEHLAVRKVVAAFFSPARVRAQTDAIITATDACIEALETSPAPCIGSAPVIDLGATVAGTVPAGVFSRLTEMPLPDLEDLNRWSADSLELFWGWPGEARQAHLAESAIELHGWLRAMVDEVSAHGTDDAGLVAELIEAELRVDQVVSLTYFLIIAGQETTRMLIATALQRALRDRDLWHRCGESGDAADALIGEVLTDASSVPTWRRITSRDALVNGQHVPAGTPLLLQVSGGVDTAECRDHLAFGHGVHRCLGAGLARLEAGLVVHRTARALPDATLAGPEPTWVNLLSFQAPRTVLVKTR